MHDRYKPFENVAHARSIAIECRQRPAPYEAIVACMCLRELSKPLIAQGTMEESRLHLRTGSKSGQNTDPICAIVSSANSRRIRRERIYSLAIHSAFPSGLNVEHLGFDVPARRLALCYLNCKHHILILPLANFSLPIEIPDGFRQSLNHIGSFFLQGVVDMVH